MRNPFSVAGVSSEIMAELARGEAKFPAGFHSYHEGYGVILEELDELWDEIKLQSPDRGRLRKEAIQVAAMAVRFIKELT